MRHFLLLISFLLVVLTAAAQVADAAPYASAFESAYASCPTLPRGVLEALSYTNTQCHHLSDADYHHEGPECMPRAYGLMGLVADGKGCFRENLHSVSALSGLAESELLASPEANVLGYARALEATLVELQGEAPPQRGLAPLLQGIAALSELPADDGYALALMLFSVCDCLADAAFARRCGFEPYELDTYALLPEYHALLTATTVRLTRPAGRPADGADYAEALWDPAPECNYGPRTEPISGVVVHYTEGSYAGCISWFKNCDAQVSAHYVIRSRDGQVTQMVHEADKAWHARSANAYTIGIEHEAYGDIASYFTPAMYAASARLVHDISTRHAGLDGHRTFYRDTLDDGRRLNSGLHDLGGAEACTQIRGHQHYPNQSHTDPGPFWDWNLYYKLINAPEANIATLVGSSGSLNHEAYADDERRIWRIESPPGTTVQLSFASFSLEKDYDFLWIYDGPDVFAPKLGRWNSTSPGTVCASGNTMCVEFRSDCRTTAAGWRATWQGVVPAEPTTPLGEGVCPNPVGEALQVNMQENAVHAAALFDLLGRQLTPTVTFVNQATIATGALPAGLYVLRYGKPDTMENAVKVLRL